MFERTHERANRLYVLRSYGVRAGVAEMIT